MVILREAELREIWMPGGRSSAPVGSGPNDQYRVKRVQSKNLISVYDQPGALLRRFKALSE